MQSVTNNQGKLSFHRTFLAGQDLKLGCPGRLTCPAKNINQLHFRSRLLSRTLTFTAFFELRPSIKSNPEVQIDSQRFFSELLRLF